MKAEYVSDTDQEESYRFFELTKDILHRLINSRDEPDLWNDLALVYIIQGKTCKKLNKIEDSKRNFKQAKVLLKRLQGLRFEFGNFRLKINAID